MFVLTLLLLLMPCSHCISNETLFNFISDYLQYKHVKLATLYICWNTKDILRLSDVLNAVSIRSNFVRIENFLRNSGFTNGSNNFIFYDVFGYVLDLKCNNAVKLLEMDADIDRWQTRFHNVYKWLILNEDASDISSTRKLFMNVKLRLDTDMLLVQHLRDSFELYNIFNSGYGKGGRVKAEKEIISGKNEHFTFKYKTSFYENRKNMSSLYLLASVVITQNTTESASDPIKYLLDVKDKEDTLSKMSYSVYVHIIDIHQFRFKINVAHIWFDKRIEVNGGGITQHLHYNRSDIAASAAIILPERVALVDYIAPTNYFWTSFTFRNPSAIGKIRNQFLDPFALNTWCVCLTFCLTFAVLLNLTDITHGYFGLFGGRQQSWSSSVLNTLAAFFQQDIEIDNQDLPGRILILCLMFLSLVLYNYYTSSIVSDLINSRTQVFNTMYDLVHSSMELGMEDIFYVGRLLQTTDDPDLIYLRDKRINVPGKPSRYFAPVEGIAKVKSGGFAYHTEPTNSYPLIARSFSSEEICELCEIFLYKPTLVNMQIQKRSEFKELFAISYRKMLERGLIQRQRKVWDPSRPACLSSASVLQIELEQAAPAFIVLLCGMLISMIVLMLEKKMKHRKINISG